MNIYITEAEETLKKYFENSFGDTEVEYTNATAQESEGNSEADVLSVFVNSRVDEMVLGKFPKLKYIATRSTGFDHIDLGACKKKNIIVANVPSYGENTVAEYAFGLLLMVSRKLYLAARRVHEEGKFFTDGLQGFDLRNKTMGVVGTGKIGCHMIRMANGFGMHVLAYDPFPKKELEQSCDMRYVSLEELLTGSDVITLHAPYMPSTHHLLNSKNFGLVKRGAVLINTARGALIETSALVTALRTGQLGGAALDVLEEEGYVGEEWRLMQSKTHSNDQLEAVLADHQLMSLPNVYITPHNAFNTAEALERILATTVDNIKSYLEGKPQNLVKNE